MDAEILWTRYSDTWSMPHSPRLERLGEVTAPDIRYTDPNIAVQGHANFSAYMDEFQKNIPGAFFRITKVYAHHGKTLSQWTMHSADGAQIGVGSSFAEVDDTGKLKAIFGFYDAG